jgi:hypothetical protein
MEATRGILWNQPRSRYRFLDDVLELFQELVLNNRLHFRLLCDHLMSMHLMGIHFMGMTSWACIRRART